MTRTRPSTWLPRARACASWACRRGRRAPAAADAWPLARRARSRRLIRRGALRARLGSARGVRLGTAAGVLQGRGPQGAQAQEACALRAQRTRLKMARRAALCRDSRAAQALGACSGRLLWQGGGRGARGQPRRPGAELARPARTEARAMRALPRGGRGAWPALRRSSRLRAGGTLPLPLTGSRLPLLRRPTRLRSGKARGRRSSRAVQRPPVRRPCLSASPLGHASTCMVRLLQHTRRPWLMASVKGQVCSVGSVVGPWPRRPWLLAWQWSRVSFAVRGVWPGRGQARRARRTAAALPAAAAAARAAGWTCSAPCRS